MAIDDIIAALDRAWTHHPGDDIPSRGVRLGIRYAAIELGDTLRGTDAAKLIAWLQCHPMDSRETRT